MAAEKYTGIQELINVFAIRKDLQACFPEVWEGDLEKLLAWALEYGVVIDAAKEILEPYEDEFRNFDMADYKNRFIWDDSVRHYISNGFKIYWETLDQVAAYQFECISGDPNMDMLSYTVNVLRNNFDGRLIRAGFIGCDESAKPEIRLVKNKFCSEVIVMDIAEGLLARQQDRCRAENITNIEYRQVDFNEFVLGEDEYDYINAWGTVHHIKNLEHFFSQIRRGLKKDGILVMYEYVGPDHLQFTNEQLGMVHALLNLLPEKLRRYQNNVDIKSFEHRIDLKKLMLTDPDESVRSGEILQIMADYFDICEFHKTGGTILHPLLNGIAGNFETSSEGEKALKVLIEVEKSLITSELLPSDYIYLVAKPKK